MAVKRSSLQTEEDDRSFLFMLFSFFFRLLGFFCFIFFRYLSFLIVLSNHALTESDAQNLLRQRAARHHSAS